MSLEIPEERLQPWFKGKLIDEGGYPYTPVYSRALDTLEFVMRAIGDAKTSSGLEMINKRLRREREQKKEKKG